MISFNRTQFWRTTDVIRMHVRQLTIDIGAVEGHRTYARFIVLGTGRIGSVMLSTALNRHTQAIVWGELFKQSESIGWDRWPYTGLHFGQSKKLRSLNASDPVTFLESRIYRKLPPSIAAVGFKLFYHQARKGLQKKLWIYLKERTDFRIIHLKRRNRLRRHLSHKRAQRTGRWIDLSEDGGANTAEPIHLDFQECRSDFARNEQREAEHDLLFEAHPTLEVFYEDLARDFRSEMDRVQRFLGLEVEVLKPITFKQSHGSLSEAIVNYAELKRRFTGSPWESFFEE